VTPPCPLPARPSPRLYVAATLREVYERVNAAPRERHLYHAGNTLMHVDVLMEIAALGRRVDQTAMDKSIPRDSLIGNYCR